MMRVAKNSMVNAAAPTRLSSSSGYYRLTFPQEANHATDSRRIFLFNLSGLVRMLLEH